MHIIALVSSAGSMEWRKEKVLETYNKFLSVAKVNSPDALFTLVIFNQYMHVLYSGDIQSASDLSEDDYHPSGGSALNDCIGTIIDVCPADMPTLFAIISDWENTECKRYDSDTTLGMIEKRSLTIERVKVETIGKYFSSPRQNWTIINLCISQEKPWSQYLKEEMFT